MTEDEGEKNQLMEKRKSHYYFSQVKQLVYDSLHLCLVFNKATLVMYLFDVLAPSSLLCLIHSPNLSLQRLLKLSCDMCMVVLMCH